MTHVTAVTGYTLLEMSRRRLLQALVLVGMGLIVVLGTLPLVLPGMTTPELRAGFLMTQMDRLVGLFLLMGGFAIGMTVIYNDLDTGAAVGILVKPVTRLQYALAKTAAAAAGVLLLAATMTAASLAVLYVDGGARSEYGAAVTNFLAAGANTLVVTLAIMILTVLMNNIVSAVVAFVGYQVVEGVATAHTSVVQGFITASPVKEIIGAAYWLVPHQLVSALPHELRRMALETGVLRVRGVTPYNGVPDPSGTGDVVFWAVYCLVLVAALSVTVHRRQV